MGIWKKIRNIPHLVKRRITIYYLVKKYPWLHPITWGVNDEGEYVEIRDPDYKYDWLRIFYDKPGWWKAFGKIFCDEIQEHYVECPDMYVCEEKEKFGELRISFGNANEAVEKICDKYEHISGNICFFCGREAPMTNAGWLLPVCPYCYVKEQWGTRPYSEVVCKDDNGKMAESYTIRHFSKDGSYDEVVDISDTVKKIRTKYAKNRQSRT